MRQLAVGILVLVLLPPVAFGQGVYFDRAAVLKAFFAASERVGYVTVKVDLTKEGAALQRRLRYRPAKAEYVVFVATTSGKVDGYAVLDEELGQHLPISFAVQLDPGGAVVRTEVMVYREGYGQEIREQRFRNQFVGRDASAPLRLGDDVVAITGATISSRSAAEVVRRAVALIELVRQRPSEVARSP